MIYKSIEELEALIQGRNNEYKLFGRTSKDLEYDLEIFQRIKLLRDKQG